MTSPAGSAQDENDAFFNNYGNAQTGATATGSLVNKVYVGPSKEKKVRLKRGGQTITVPAGDETINTTEAKRKYLTDEKLRANWNVILRKNGLEADPLQARAIWDMAVEGASDWYSTSNGQQKITPEQYVTWYATGRTKKKGPAMPTRQIYAVSEEQIASDINDIAVKTLGRELQDTDRGADWYQDLVKGINKLYSKGTLTTVQEVKNTQTGKMEKVVTQTPGFSKQQITEQITQAVEEADPASLERKQNLDFANWAFQKMGGRG